MGPVPMYYPMPALPSCHLHYAALSQVEKERKQRLDEAAAAAAAQALFIASLLTPGIPLSLQAAAEGDGPAVVAGGADVALPSSAAVVASVNPFFMARKPRPSAAAAGPPAPGAAGDAAAPPSRQVLGQMLAPVHVRQIGQRPAPPDGVPSESGGGSSAHLGGTAILDALLAGAFPPAPPSRLSVAVPAAGTAAKSPMVGGGENSPEPPSVSRASVPGAEEACPSILEHISRQMQADRHEAEARAAPLLASARFWPLGPASTTASAACAARPADAPGGYGAGPGSSNSLLRQLAEQLAVEALPTSTECLEVSTLS